ncbi:unnamed protein product [Lactuca virosa]|uniref:F-box domain-containing protein n=1 Tax=Lactuca virosa TaxID=75947 RepID=A0AAU9M2E1_9ASTR|nr:unnamed protein product [Lactuca virosa]CAH1416145.1 unnamed protein product [Lactuca virosa]
MTRDQSHDETCDSGGVAPWLELNHDLLYLVLMRLGVVDFVAFSGVCKSWRSFALSNWNMFMASKPPLSMSTSTNVNEREERYLYLEDFDGRKFKTILPRLVGRDFVGLSCGYLAFYGYATHDFWLVNPITRHQLHFPDVHFEVYTYDELAIKLILVFSPSIPGWVLAVENGLDRKIWTSIAGKGAWNLVSSPFQIIDFHAFKGKYYDFKAPVNKQQSSKVSDIISENKEDVSAEEVDEEVDDAYQEGVDEGELPPLDNSDPLPEVANEGTQVRRSERVRAPSTRYPTSNYILLTSEGEPESFQEAQSHIDKANWQKAMEEEMNSL